MISPLSTDSETGTNLSQDDEPLSYLQALEPDVQFEVVVVPHVSSEHDCTVLSDSGRSRSI
jgi:hypothetical protein